MRRSHLGEIFWNDRREMPALRLIIHASFLREIFSAGYAPFYLKKDGSFPAFLAAFSRNRPLTDAERELVRQMIDSVEEES